MNFVVETPTWIAVFEAKSEEDAITRATSLFGPQRRMNVRQASEEEIAFARSYGAVYRTH